MPATRTIVLLLAEDPQRARNLQVQAAARLGERGISTRYRSLTDDNVARLADVLQSEGCGILVLPARGAALQDSVLLALLEQLDLPVLLVT